MQLFSWSTDRSFTQIFVRLFVISSPARSFVRWLAITLCKGWNICWRGLLLWILSATLLSRKFPTTFCMVWRQNESVACNFTPSPQPDFITARLALISCKKQRAVCHCDCCLQRCLVSCPVSHTLFITWIHLINFKHTYCCSVGADFSKQDFVALGDFMSADSCGCCWLMCINRIHDEFVGCCPD